MKSIDDRIRRAEVIPIVLRFIDCGTSASTAIIVMLPMRDYVLR
jgi:hypothetical protein